MMAEGLSPRVRGNQVAKWAADTPCGSIPACAGEPSSKERSTVQYTVYPRVCGGTLNPEHSRWLMGGLSPRVRGNLAERPDKTFCQGSIPACAGEPPAPCSPRLPSRVYPRVCEGTKIAPMVSPYAPGLSPRVRGNPRYSSRCGARLGSIPACAGEPRGQRCSSGGHRVYPRVCGGTVGNPSFGQTQQGLSPRVRGNLSFPPVTDRRRGSIPACAGEPPRLRLAATAFRVYPRVCGGTRFRVRSGPRVQGLSPRVRGNR